MPAPGLLLLVDLDGVLYRGAEPVPGIAAVLATRASRGDDVVYVTNNSMWYREDYVERIARMGAPVSADQIVSSPRATALYLRDHEPSIRHVLTVGASGMDRELEDAGFRVTPAGDIGELIRGSGAEGTGPGGELFGEARAVGILCAHAQASAAQLSARMLEALQAFAPGAAQQDDITMVFVKREAGA